MVTFTAGTGAGQGNAVWVEEWSGILATSSPVDTPTANGANGVSAAPSSGSTGPLSQASELVVGAISANVAVTGPGSPWVNEADIAAGGVALIAGHQVVSSTGAQTYSGTMTSGSWGAVVAGLRLAASAPPSSPSGFSGLFIYSPAPGPGNLVASFAAAAGTDPYGNKYPADLTIGLNTKTQIQIASNDGVGVVEFLLNNAGFVNGLLESAIIGSSAQVVLNGPANTTAGHTDFVGLELNSSDGISSSANMQFVYTDASGGVHEVAYVDSGGFHVLGALQIDGAGSTLPLASVPQFPVASGSSTNTVIAALNALYNQLVTGQVIA